LGTISTYQVFTGNYGNTFWGFGQAVDSGSGFRLWGPIGDPNYYAEIMVTLVPFAVERFLHEKKIILRFMSGWAIFVLLVSIYYTSSRGGFLALLVVGFLVFASQPSRPYAGILLFGILLFASYQYIPVQYTERISTLLQLVPGNRTSAKLDPSLQDRASANIIGWAMFTDHPIFGVGAGNFNANFDHYARLLGLSREAGSAHNLYLEIASERGILGLLSFTAIIYSTFRVLQRTKKSFIMKDSRELANICDALTVGLVGYLVAATFLHDAYIRYLWLLLGIAWSVPQVLKSLAGEQTAEDGLNSLRVVYNE
jgi:putative inorganic carbon (HCO3(-)) transporter